MEAAQTANNTKLAGLETSVGRVDKSLAALLKHFDDLHAKTRNQHKGRDQEDEDGAENSSVDYGPYIEIEDRDQRHLRQNREVWVDITDVRYITMIMLSAR
jgi:hypothetical protein